MTTTKAAGILCMEADRAFVRGTDGTRFFTSDLIWEGYLRHWLGRKVCARRLPQKDYETGKSIVLVWPDEKTAENPFVELYYNERLIKYPASLLGHIAVNIYGEVFNYSHLLNEDEVMTAEEYFYRPALGEFAPHPRLGRYHVDEDGKAYYDKFGRRFMRTVHVLTMEGLPTDLLSAFYHQEMEEILGTPEDPKRPGVYPHFNLFTRNCTTIIRDGLRKAGLSSVKGMFPRDFFINVAWFLSKHAAKMGITVKLHRMDQLRVPEAPASALPFPVNPANMLRLFRLQGTQLARE